jgi:uncharacterized membrane protein YbhN (UPF0104 family)
VTGGLVALVLWRLDPRALTARATSLDAAWTGLAFALVFLAIAVSAWKWGIILASRGRGLPYARLVRHYFVGLFFNNVLPTTVGGDAVRAWETSRDTGEVPEAVGSVITERLVAGAALGITALLGLPFVHADVRLVLLVLAFLAIDVGLVALFLVPRVAEGIVSATLPRRLAAAKEAAHDTVAVVRASLRAPRLFAKVAVLSIVFQLLVAAVNAALFEAMGAPVGLGRCVVYTPMVFTVTMLPVSLSGLGVREAAYWWFFSRDGVGEADAVAASLCFFIVVALASLPGAALFAFGRRGAVALSTEPTSP